MHFMFLGHLPGEERLSETRNNGSTNACPPNDGNPPAQIGAILRLGIQAGGQTEAYAPTVFPRKGHPPPPWSGDRGGGSLRRGQGKSTRIPGLALRWARRISGRRFSIAAFLDQIHHPDHAITAVYYISDIYFLSASSLSGALGCFIHDRDNKYS